MGELPALDPRRLGPPAGSRVAVIGGSGGMGRALVAALRVTDVRVAVLDLPASLEQHPVPEGVLGVAVDGSDAASVERAFASVASTWDALDGAVNLAGFMKHWGKIADMDPAHFDEVVQGNLRTHFLCARAAIPLLKKGRAPSLVNVTSTLGLDVHPGYVHYSASKAAIIALTKGMARENAPEVRVNALAPGLTDTAFLVGGTGRPRVFDGMDPDLYARRVPLRRIAVADDMVGPMLFLLGPASRYMTGETVIVDGGVYQQ